MQARRLFILLAAGLIGLMPSPCAAQEPLELVQTIVLKGKTGKLDHVALDKNRQRLFLANKVNNTLDVVDLQGGKLFKQITGQSGVQGIAIAPDLNKVFVALGEGGFCNVLDAETYKVLKTRKFKDDADNVRYNQRTGLVYVAHAEKALAVLDAKSVELKADIALPGSAEGFEHESNRPRLYVCVPPTQVLVIDTDKNEIGNTYTVSHGGKVMAVAVDEANHRLFVASRKPAAMLTVMDSESGKEITSVPIAEEVDDCYFDAKRKLIYASCGEGFLAVIKQKSADEYEPVAKVPTAAGAKTCLYDAGTDKLYLAVPRQQGNPGPEIRIYQPK
jgi:DNA-binding beta-propeller fold protein YncE